MYIIETSEKRKMNEESDNDCLLWENNEEWLAFLNSNDDQVESGEKFANDKLPDLNRSNTCQPLTTVKATATTSTVGRKTRAPNQKKNDKRKGKTKFNVDGNGKGESSHKSHILTERERRKKMRKMYSELQTLVPQLHSKADKCTIVGKTMKYIMALKNTYDELKEQKEERLKHGIGSSREAFMADHGSICNSTVVTPTNHNIPISCFQTWSSSNVVLNICGEDAHFSVCCPKKPGLFSEICYMLEKYKIDIVSVQLSSDHYKSMFMIQARVNSFSETFPVEEVYKQAGSEIMSLVTPK